ncbi:uncharacterized protein LOC661370 [Tribolium castaneum]|uniref:Protein TsetseEP domain-containing protein n=1 Tax=Tribolium castaneum TaxID=7070 RepID=A0A139WJL6_TRICA|nr:PREDICTED: uncharacterized protein LOC661370 [Tribolium castaneum]KYB28170.1 hypothetical protein TcasGA2_TC032933 [Tribolium castaneum]|eukprot:XP_976384.1 PREDICTED: uncharacterized protein LOC661370 [Tribolium castaneum]
MNSKFVVTLVVAFCLVQGNHAETIDEVVADMTTRINAIKTNIDGIIHDGGKLVGETHKIIGTIVAQAEATVYTQIDQLNNIVQQAQAEAAQKAVDISQCVNVVTDALGALDLHKLDACNNQEGLNTLRAKLGLLGRLKQQLSNSITGCLAKNPISAVALRSCIQGEIDSVNNQVVQIQEEINLVTAESAQNAQNCAHAASQSLLKTIDTVAHDFRNCVSAIL